jgi:hypothetical protein
VGWWWLIAIFLYIFFFLLLPDRHQGMKVKTSAAADADHASSVRS